MRDLKSDGVRTVRSPAAKAIQTPDDFRQEKFAIENAKHLAVPPKVASFVYKNTVQYLKANMKCRNELGDVEISLVENASTFIASEFDKILDREICSQFPDLLAGADEKVPLKYNSFVRALTGDDRFYVEVFEIVRVSDFFKAIENEDALLTRFEVNEELAKDAVRWIRKVGGFKAALGFKLVLLGKRGVGKTALVQNFVKGTFDESAHKPTLGLEYHTKDIVDGDKALQVNIWDTAGEERWGNITNTFCRRALGAFIVYDVTESDDVSCYISQAKENNIQDIVVFGNKVDSLKHEGVSDHSNVNGMRKSNGVVCFTGSAKTGEMVNEAFDRLIQMALDRHCQEKPLAPPNDTVKDTFSISPTKAETDDQKLPRNSSCCR